MLAIPTIALASYLSIKDKVAETLQTWIGWGTENLDLVDIIPDIGTTKRISAATDLIELSRNKPLTLILLALQRALTLKPNLGYSKPQRKKEVDSSEAATPFL